MKLKKLIKMLKQRTIDFDVALEILASKGFPPNIFYDDNGHWAVSFDGLQTIPLSSGNEDIAICSFIEKDKWQNNLWDALIKALEE